MYVVTVCACVEVRGQCTGALPNFMHYSCHADCSACVEVRGQCAGALPNFMHDSGPQARQ